MLLTSWLKNNVFHDCLLHSDKKTLFPLNAFYKSFFFHHHFCLRFLSVLGSILAPSWPPFGGLKTSPSRVLSAASWVLKRPQQPKRPQAASKTPKMTFQVAKMIPQEAKMTFQVSKMTLQVAILASQSGPPTTHNLTQNTTHNTEHNTTQQHRTQDNTAHLDSTRQGGGALLLVAVEAFLGWSWGLLGRS